MKKTLSILVSAICLVAVIFVAVFGTKPQGIVPRVYIESLRIEPMDMSAYHDDESGHYCVIAYDPALEIQYGEDYYMPYVFTTRILPDNATDRSFNYVVSSDYRDWIDFPPDNPDASRRGAFLIRRNTSKKVKMARVNVRPLDGGNGSGDELRIVLDYSSVVA